MICFYGKSHAPAMLAAAAMAHGLAVTDDPKEATIIFVSEDSPTDEEGKRDVGPIRLMVDDALWHNTEAAVVLTSQVPPGFTRSFNENRLFHLAETLRMKDALHRAKWPEQFIVGVANPHEYVLPRPFCQYLLAHSSAKVLVMSYEEAEFAKIAINMTLASQVDNANRLSEAARKVGARWSAVVEALKLDKRIGEHSYLTPGRWQDSRHLLRDHVTLQGILK
jgi:UDPglucose 6-dehydrogenase